MKKLFLVAMLLVAVAGCAQNLQTQSQGTKPTIKTFEACGLSVKFSGQPDEMPGSMSTLLSKEFDVKPAGATWMYLSDIQGIRKSEFALCVCPPEATLTRVKESMIFNQRFVDGIGMISEAPPTEIENGVKMQLQTTISIATNCVALQGFAVKGASDGEGNKSAPFFSSLAPIIKAPQPPTATSSSPTVSERLRQLNQLLSEKLITPDEYSIRRAKIVEAL